MFQVNITLAALAGSGRSKAGVRKTREAGARNQVEGREEGEPGQ